ncbi:hypothetical protein VE00_10505 [Pseudogymnoascus sp. WSF 3629]|nr:hypothetical protein VE00_10505 [Pseudogymnoascus sp. WSF 3629]
MLGSNGWLQKTKGSALKVLRENDPKLLLAIETYRLFDEKADLGLNRTVAAESQSDLEQAQKLFDDFDGQDYAKLIPLPPPPPPSTASGAKTEYGIDYSG